PGALGADPGGQSWQQAPQPYRRAGGNGLGLTGRTLGDWGPPGLRQRWSGGRRPVDPSISRLQPGRGSIPTLGFRRWSYGSIVAPAAALAGAGSSLSPC